MIKTALAALLLTACATDAEPELPGDQVASLDEFPLDDLGTFAMLDNEKCLVDLTDQPVQMINRAPAFLPSPSPTDQAFTIGAYTDRPTAWTVSVSVWAGDGTNRGAAVQLEPDGQTVLWRRCEP